MLCSRPWEKSGKCHCAHNFASVGKLTDCWDEVTAVIGIKWPWLLKAASTPIALSHGSVRGGGKLAAVSPSWARAVGELASQPCWGSEPARAPAARAQEAAAAIFSSMEKKELPSLGHTGPALFPENTFFRKWYFSKIILENCHFSK